MIILAQKQLPAVKEGDCWEDIEVDSESEFRGVLCMAAKLRLAGATGVFRVFNHNGTFQTIQIKSSVKTVYTVSIDEEPVDV